MLIVLNKAIVHAVGEFDEAGLRVLPTRRARRRDPELEARIDEAWRRRTEAAPDRFHDAPLARLVAHGLLPDKLALFVGETTFREFVGTNLEAQSDPSIHESLGEDYFANPLGVSAIIVSKDDAILLGQRSQNTVEASGQWDLPGGHISILDGAACSPFETIRRELHEELGLGRSDIASLRCVGLVENGLTHKPELIFLARTNERAKKLEKRATAHADAEHDAFMTWSSSKGDLLDLLRTRGEELTPVAAGGLGILVA